MTGDGATPPAGTEALTELLRQLLTDVRRARSRLVTLALLSTVAGLSEAAVLVLAVRAAMSISQGGEPIFFEVPGIASATFSASDLALIALAAASTNLVLHVVVDQSAARLATDVLSASRARVLHAFGRATWERQSREAEGALQETIGLATQSSELAGSIAQFLSSALNLATLLLVAVFVAPLISLVVLLAAGGLFILLYPFSRMARRAWRTSVQATSNFNESITETSNLAFELRSFGVADHEIERIIERSNEAAALSRRSQLFGQMGLHLYRDVGLIVLVFAIWILTRLGDLNLVAVGSVVLLMLRGLSAAQAVNQHVHQMTRQRASLEELGARVDKLEADAEASGSATVERLGTVVIHSVDYFYPESQQPALCDLNVVIPAGEMLGVVGPSGSGKSTLVQLLLRLRQPSSGEILIDGRPIEEISSESWARIAAMVPQEPRLFSGTVAENIAFRRQGFSREQLVQAARDAHVADEIERLPDGFDTHLGPRGGGLSGGQRQRLAIARALVGAPELLVLDEPTSALDVHSEQALQRTIGELAGRVTLVIIAHRLTTIAACDRLLILDGGKQVALGAPHEVADHPFLHGRLPG